ncbi:MAG: ACT domain-containing protein [Candidatus Eisenbacteria bacterium]|nr:ACT domain-containing protein [Candidatus Eisenbacteria bacterium]
MEKLRVEANTQVSKLVLRGVPDRPGIAAEIFGVLGSKGFNVELVVTSGGTRGTADIVLAVSQEQREDIREALQDIKKKVQAEDIQADTDVALVSVTGANLAKVPGVAGRLFHALSSRGINIDVISTSLSSVTCIIARVQAESSVAALKEEFSR